MTITTIWTCDNHHCGKKVEGREPKWLTLGSEDGSSLRIRNPIGKHGLRETNSHGDMHFCSSTCLIKAFFGQHVAALEREEVERLIAALGALVPPTQDSQT